MKLHSSLLSWFVITLYCTPLAFAQQSTTPHIITLFFKPALKQYCQGPACELLGNLHIPGQINRIILSQNIMAQIISGIYVSYAGFVTHSDYNGQVSFPLKYAHDNFTIIVTESIKPVLLFSNTVHHLEFAENTPAVMYSFTEEKRDKKAVWVVKKVAITDHKIPDNALIIFSQPSHIIIAEGIFKADEGPNVILPHIYVAENTPLSVNALQFVKLAKFFAPVVKAFGYAPERYADIIAN